ncbi:hydroxyacid dehydrogenase [Salipiger sp.]|uniref:hydroxyacid dehydrogenase n=1 Tax=Salipiger sp. TaxID=2078585 RepID=UPI003A980244
MKTILVTGPDLDPGAVKLMKDHGFEAVHTPPYADSAVIAEHLVRSRAEGIVSRMGRLDASVMDAAPWLRVISKHGVGVDNIDVAAASRRGIPVLVATGANAVSVAEHAVALMLATVKRVLPLDAGLRAGRWEKPGFLGRELLGARLGLVGMGAIAQATGRIAAGLGLKLYGHDPFAPDAAFEAIGATRCAGFEDLLAQSDVLSLHCPLNDQTRGLLNAGAIARMPEGSYVVNTARGGLIDEDALLAAIASGQLAGAGLDTFAVEPPAPDHPFFAEPRIVLTPHIGGVTRQAGARVGVDAVRGILQILEGRPVAPERIVNRALLPEAGVPLVKAGD